METTCLFHSILELGKSIFFANLMLVGCFCYMENQNMIIFSFPLFQFKWTFTSKMSSSPYVVLGSRSLDKWKVTELKEELKRRRLTTSGLKADLIKRLDEAVRIEWESATEQNENTFTNASQFELSTHQEKNNVDIGDSKDFIDESYLNNRGTSEPQSSMVGNYNTEPKASQENSHLEITHSDDLTQFCGSIGSSMHFVPQKDSNSQNIETQNQAVNTTVEPEVDYGFVLSQQDLHPFKYEGVPDMDCDLGFQLRSDLVSAESFPISEKNEPMFDTITDDIKLDVDVKHDTVQPSASDFVDAAVESYKVNVEEPPDEKLPFDEVGGGTATAIDSLQNDTPENLGLDQNSVDASMEENVLRNREVEYESNSKRSEDNLEKPIEKEVSLETDGGNIKNDGALEKVDATDLDLPEKLSIDQSSSDEFVEDDVLESKQVEQNANSLYIKENIGRSAVPTGQKEKFVDVISIDKPIISKAETSENEPVKRKFIDQEAANNDMGKRQRIYNADGLKVSEKQSVADVGSMVPINLPQATLRTFSRSDSTVSEEAAKERVVPPPSNSPSNSLRIDHFLRPFTLKAVQELLAKTGTVTNFWMDNIKTHCYVSYSSIEEAVTTRNAVYNLQWPPHGGRLLVAEFVDPQEVTTRVESPQSPATPRNTTAQHQQRVPTHSLLPQPSLSKQPSLRECSNLSRLPVHEKDRLNLAQVQKLPEEIDPPILALDDLFRKTKAAPRIYYLPLSDEQVATKLKTQGKNTTN